MDSKKIKLIGILASAIGFGVTLLSDWVNDKKMDEKIAEKIVELTTKEK